MEITSTIIKDALNNGRPNPTLNKVLFPIRTWLDTTQDAKISDIYPVYNCNYSLRKIFSYLYYNHVIHIGEIKKHKKQNPSAILYPLDKTISLIQDKRTSLPDSLEPLRELDLPSLIMLIGLLELSEHPRKGILLGSDTAKIKNNLEYSDTIIFGCLNIMHPIYQLSEYAIQKIGLPIGIYTFYNDNNINKLADIINKL